MSSLNPVPIIFENKDLLVVDKPTGIDIHNSPASVLNQLETSQEQKLWPVHRLDKETSGVLLLAKNKIIASELHSLFEPTELPHSAASLKKTYVALLRGSWKNVSQQVTWTFPISDQAEGRRAPAGPTSKQKKSVTHVQLLSTNRYFSLVECQLASGRQHQIRKHAALAKQPIVGDERYNDPAYNKKITELYQTLCLFLHASQLRLFWRGQNFHWQSPLPKPFEVLMRPSES